MRQCTPEGGEVCAHTSFISLLPTSTKSTLCTLRGHAGVSQTPGQLVLVRCCQLQAPAGLRQQEGRRRGFLSAFSPVFMVSAAVVSFSPALQ